MVTCQYCGLMSTSYEVSRRGFWSINEESREALSIGISSVHLQACFVLFCCSVFMFRVSVSTSLSFLLPLLLPKEV